MNIKSCIVKFFEHIKFHESNPRVLMHKIIHYINLIFFLILVRKYFFLVSLFINCGINFVRLKGTKLQFNKVKAKSTSLVKTEGQQVC